MKEKIKKILIIVFKKLEEIRDVFEA